MKDWIKRSVIYQIYPRSFMDSNGDGIGDLNGITSKLEYVRDLGVNVIWLNPIYASPNDDMGYDISDYRDIMREFGTIEDFTRLLNKAHELGLKIMMDLVVNHTSDEHEWFKKSLRKEGKYKDFYIWKDPVDGKEPNNWGSSFQGSAWTYAPERKQYYLHTFSTKQPDLNWDNIEVREEIYSLMEFWLNKGVDGFRMDVINYISKTPEMPDGPIMANGYGNFRPYCLNGPKCNEYLKEMRKRVLSKYDVITVGETPGVTPSMAFNYSNLDGSELDMIFQFQHMGVDNGKYGKWSDTPFDFMKLKTILSDWHEQLEGKAWNSLYWDNHDQPRGLSRFGNDSTEEYRVRSAKMLALCLFGMKGTQYIHYGDEIGMTNVAYDSIEKHKDIDTINSFKAFVEKGVSKDEMMRYVHKKSRDNGRTPMQWNECEHGGFSKVTPWLEENKNYKTINVSSQLNDPDSILSFYKRIINLKRNNPILIDGKFQLMDKEDNQLFSFCRSLNNDRIEVYCNFSDSNTKKISPKGRLLISNMNDETEYLRPYEARMYTTEEI